MVLLILAGVSLNLVLGSNGIVTKSKEAVIENAHSTVYEALGVENNGFSIDIETGNSKEDFLDYLISKNLIDDNNVVNVPNLLGKSLKTGNGTEDDIYVITENETDGTYEPIKIKKIVVPSEIDGVKVTTIGIKYVNGNRFFYKGFGNPYVEEIVLPDTIVKFYGPSAMEVDWSHSGVFQDCSNLKKINIPESVTDIPSATFRNCSSLENIILPQKLTSIRWRAFYNCTSLKKLTIPSSVTYISDATFNGCNDMVVTVKSGTSLTANDLKNAGIKEENIHFE